MQYKRQQNICMFCCLLYCIKFFGSYSCFSGILVALQVLPNVYLYKSFEWCCDYVSGNFTANICKGMKEGEKERNLVRGRWNKFRFVKLAARGRRSSSISLSYSGSLLLFSADKCANYFIHITKYFRLNCIMYLWQS